MENILKWLPAATAAALVSSIIYTVGYFRPFGIELASTITVQDLFANSWIMLPTLMMGLAFGGLLRGSRQESFASRFASKEFHSKRPRIGILLSILATIFTVIPFNISFFISNSNPTLFIVLASPILLAHIHAIDYLLNLSPMTNAANSHNFFLIYTFCVSLFTFGTIVGFSKMAADPNYRIYTSESTFYCATLLSAGERGVLSFNKKTKTTTFAKWDSIRLLSRSESCES